MEIAPMPDVTSNDGIRLLYEDTGQWPGFSSQC
jgi:hypothetical protein